MADYKAMADSIAAKFGIPTDIFRSMIGKESGWNPNAVGTSGEKGLGQLMPGTAAMMGVSNPLDALQNLTGSAGYLRKMYDQFGTWNSALSAYNAGPGGVNSAAGQAYASSVLSGADGTPTSSNPSGATPAKTTSAPGGILLYSGAILVIVLLLVFGLWGAVKG